MTIRKLCSSDYDELLSMLNETFTEANGKEMDFLLHLPKMWERTDEAMGKHIGLFEDGKLCSVVGIYPLPVRIGGREFLFATTGNIATRPECQGKGYFSILFDLAMKALEAGGFDAARLGGQRQRYARYGFEGCGLIYEFVIMNINCKKAFGDSYKDIEWISLTEADTEALAFCRELANSKCFYVERYGNDGERDVFRAMCAKKCVPYVAKKGNERIGYVCAKSGGKSVLEIRARTCDELAKMVCAWQDYVGETITLTVAPYMTEELSVLAQFAQDVTLTAPAMFKILHWDRLCDVLMKLSFSLKKLPMGEVFLKIKEYGILRFYVAEDGAGCELSSGSEFDIELDKSQAPGVIFGPFSPSWISNVPHLLDSWFPLPLTWDFMDFV